MVRKRRPGRTISKKQVQKLLTDSLWTADAEFSYLQPTVVYRHPDGRVLYFPGDSGMLVEASNGKGYIEWLRTVRREYEAWIAENPRGRHILVGRLPLGRDFAAQVPSLIAELPNLLKLSPDDLDFSDASLERVDKILKRLGRKKCLEPPIFPALVAYVGEMFRRKYNAEWRMRWDKVDKRVCEPWVVVPRSGHACRIAPGLHDAFTERALSIRGAIPLWVGRWQVFPPEFWEETNEER